MQIAREQQSLSEALAWTALAGDQIDKVIANAIHKRARAQSFSQASLERVLALDDRLAINRVAAIDRDARNVLLELERDKLVGLARTLGEAELGMLARYLTGLRLDARQRLLRIIGDEPAKMRNLLSPRVREAILASRDQLAAVGMMLTETAALDFVSMSEHAGLVWSGEVSPILLWDRHPGGVIRYRYCGADRAIGIAQIVVWPAPIARDKGLSRNFCARSPIKYEARTGSMAAPPTKRDAPTGRIPLLTTDSISGTRLRHGTMLCATAVSGANVLRDLREAVTNTLGGQMLRYENLLDLTIDRALTNLEAKAIDAGYDAVVGLRISHPVITDGACEVVAYGTGVWLDAT